MGRKEVEEIILKVKVDNKQARKALDGLETNTKTATKKVDGLNRAFKVIGGLAIANQLKNIASSAIEVSDSFTRVTNSLQTTFGSMEAANQQMEFLDENAQKLGVDLLATSKGFSLLAASGKSAGLETKEVQDIFTAASEASVALSLSADDTNGVLLAMSQIMSKGKVQAEELRGQIGERLPGAFNIAAESMGLTTQELDKMMQSGNLSASEFMPAFAKALKETFHEGAMNNASKTIAQATRNQNEWNKSLKEIGGPLKEVSTGIGSFLVESLGEAADGAFTLTTAFVNMIGFGEEAAKNLDRDASAMGDFGATAGKTTKEVEKLSESIIALNAIEVKFEAAQEIDAMQEKLGLTTKGFELIKRGFGGGKALLKLFSDKDEKTQEKFFKNINKILGAQKGGASQFFKINQEDIEFSKTLDKWMGGTFDPFAGLDPAIAQTFGKVGDFAKADKKAVEEVSQGPINALEVGSAEALRFAARPVEKNMEKIAEEQLTVQGQIKDGIAAIGANQNQVNTQGI